MAAILFKLFPTLWPFLIELIVGGKDHPHSFERDGVKRPGLVTVLLFIITALGYILATTIEDRDKISKELQEAHKPSSKVQDLSVSLYVCEKARKDLDNEIISLETKMQMTTSDLLACNAKPLVTCPTNNVTPTLPQSLAEKARHRLESMRTKD